jgi:hypothetical protein
MPEMGQKLKSSTRAEVFRLTADSGPGEGHSYRSVDSMIFAETTYGPSRVVDFLAPPPGFALALMYRRPERKS